MRCMACGSETSAVIESRAYYGGRVVVRRRECPCGNRWTTDEKVRAGSNTLSIAGPAAKRPTSNSGSPPASDPPVIAGKIAKSHAMGSVSKPLGGLGGTPIRALVPVSQSDPSGPSKPDPLGPNIMRVFAHYRRYHPRSLSNPTAATKEARLVRDRLREGHTVEDLQRAIDGYHSDPFHLGQNDSGTKYLDLTLILRDSSHVTRGVEYLEPPSAPPVSKNGTAVEGYIELLRNGGVK